jgi:trans-aconitate methyltransferase
MMPDGQNTWTEENSKRYQELAAVAVPAREEQVAVLLALLPFRQNEPFQAIELGCGEGFFTLALLECFPQASVVALDGSAEMRARTTERICRFGARAPAEAALPRASFTAALHDVRLALADPLQTGWGGHTKTLHQC